GPDYIGQPKLPEDDSRNSRNQKCNQPCSHYRTFTLKGTRSHGIKFKRMYRFPSISHGQTCGTRRPAASFQSKARRSDTSLTCQTASYCFWRAASCARRYSAISVLPSWVAQPIGVPCQSVSFN